MHHLFYKVRTNASFVPVVGLSKPASEKQFTELFLPLLRGLLVQATKLGNLLFESHLSIKNNALRALFFIWCRWWVHSHSRHKNSPPDYFYLRSAWPCTSLNLARSFSSPTFYLLKKNVAYATFFILVPVT